MSSYNFGFLNPWIEIWQFFLNSESNYGYWKTSPPQKHMILACVISNKALWLQLASRKIAAHCIDISTNIGFKIVVFWVVLELRDKIEMLLTIILHCIVTYIN